MTTIASTDTASASNSSSSGAGNIFIRNLDKAIDQKALFKIFSLYGNILYCKVAVDEEGIIKGFGFFQCNTDDAAQNAVLKAS